MSTTLETTLTPIPARTDALRYYRLAVLVLGVALAAMIAATVYLAVRSTPTTTPVGSSTSEVNPGTSPDQCFRPAVPC
jgi:hypothetical protein